MSLEAFGAMISVKERPFTIAYNCKYYTYYSTGEECVWVKQVLVVIDVKKERD